MSNHMFVLAFAVGAALLAIWIQVRFPSHGPERFGGTMLHAGIAFVILKIVTHVGDATLSGLAFLVLFPALVYALLCTLWMLKLTQTALGLSR